MPIPYSAQTVLLEGDDAPAFAQAQFSSNVRDLLDGHWQFSAWLDARGRVRFFFHLARLSDQRLLLLLRGGDAAAMTAALQPYVFRSRVRISACPPSALGTGAALPLHAVRQQGDASLASAASTDGTLVFGCDTHSLVIGNAVAADDTWRLPQIRTCWPWLPDGVLDQWLPPALGLDRLGATALDKGCYPGQELVARLHYRGGYKRHLHHVQLSRPLPPGTALRQGEHEPVQLLDVVPCGTGAEALAIVPQNLRGDGGAGTFSTQAGTGVFEVQVTILETPLSPLANAGSAQ